MFDGASGLLFNEDTIDRTKVLRSKAFPLSGGSLASYFLIFTSDVQIRNHLSAKMKGYIKRHDDGKIIIDSNGFITIAPKDESVMFQIHLSEIDEKEGQIWFNVNEKNIYVDIYPGWEQTENETVENKTVEDNKTSSPSTSKGGNAVFPWCDASTKLFLKEYKIKKNLVKNRKLKNMKLGYQEISKNLQDHGYNVSPLQVENRFKTLKRAYKNMILSNRRTGRGRYICSYEQELDELFAIRHAASELEINEKMNIEAIESDVESALNFDKDNSGINARLEIQNIKIINSLQGSQRAIKTLITKMENKSKTSNDLQHKLLQVYIEMRDMQKEAYARAEEQRQKASEQRERRNNLLEEITTLLKSRRET